MKAIRNAWEELPAPRLSLDYFKDMPLEEVEDGIRQAVDHVSKSILTIGIALCYIERGAFIAAGFHTWEEYIERIEDRTHLPKQTASDWRRIGDAYLRHGSWLREIGYSEDRGLHKLRYLDRILEKRGKTAAKKAMLDLSHREMLELLKDEKTAHEPETKDKYLKRFNQEIDEILSAGEIPYLIGVYDRGEMLVLQNAKKRHRQSR